MPIKVTDTTGRLPHNPAEWPDGLKRVIAECCCGSSSSVKKNPFSCCPGLTQPVDLLPDTFTVRVDGTLTHNGDYPVTINPDGQKPSWWIPEMGDICGLPQFWLNALNPIWVSELYEDFKITWECPYTIGRCPIDSATNNVSWSYYYYVVFQGCSISIRQIRRVVTHQFSAGSLLCPPFDTTTTQWDPVQLGQFGCPVPGLWSKSDCSDISCDPFKFKLRLINTGGLAIGPVFVSSIDVGACESGGFNAGNPALTITYEPDSTCLGGVTNGPSAEIVL